MRCLLLQSAAHDGLAPLLLTLGAQPGPSLSATVCPGLLWSSLMGCSLQARYTDAAARTHGRANCGGILRCRAPGSSRPQTQSSRDDLMQNLACPWPAPSLVRPRHNPLSAIRIPHTFSQMAWPAGHTALRQPGRGSRGNCTQEHQSSTASLFSLLPFSSPLHNCLSLLCSTCCASCLIFTLPFSPSLISSSKRVLCRKALRLPHRQGAAATW